MKTRNTFIEDARRRGWAAAEPRWFSLFPPASPTAMLVLFPAPPLPARREAA